ncbi:MAG: VWA domain-containing protein [Vicinamibacteria bacterium]|nr:VWA domain-containing protein [Vicinamibacteria bacterium]
MGRLAVLAIGLLTSELLSGAQSPPQPADPPRFRVGVDVVRIDAVVTDKDGNLVTDLTADDFELRQDGEPQTITLAHYVAVDAPQSGPTRLASTNLPGTMAAPIVSSGRLTRAKVQRTMVLVVDDLGIAWENMDATRKALRRFVDEEVQEGDLVALVRTGAFWGALQQLTTDRRVLHAAIDQVRWTALSRRGVGSFEPVNDWRTGSSVQTPGGGANTGFTNPDPLDLGTLDDLRESMSASASLSAMVFAITGMRDLPGRKAVVLLSEGFTFIESGSSQPEDRVSLQVRRLTDMALRTGTVIYAMDPRGLMAAGLTAEDNLKVGGPAAAVDHATDRRQSLLQTQDAMASLAEITGGLAVLNTNDLGRGLKRISDDQRGYYVIGYAPPEGTFAAPGKTPRFHQFSLKVRRPGLRVRTRQGFLGESDIDRSTAEHTPQQALNDAAVSPFLAGDIPLRATLVPGYDQKTGASVRALLHIDATTLTFTPEPETGTRTAKVDVVGIVVDEWGVPVSQRNSHFTATLAKDAGEGTLQAGIVYSLIVPVKRAGGFQVRFAVRDATSGALGAAGEFVQIPELTKGALALSGVVLGEESQSAMAPGDETAAVAQISSPALRVFAPGARLVYTYEIYNAAAPVDTRVTVWRDGRPYFSAPPATLTPLPKPQPTKAAGGIKLGDRMPPGDYVFQVSAITKPTGRGKPKAATRWTTFEVRQAS